MLLGVKNNEIFMAKQKMRKKCLAIKHLIKEKVSFDFEHLKTTKSS
jgi:hypothetical protein